MIEYYEPPAIYSYEDDQINSNFDLIALVQGDNTDFKVSSNPIRTNDWPPYVNGETAVPTRITKYKEPPLDKVVDSQYLNYTYGDLSKLSSLVVFYLVEIPYTELPEDYKVEFKNGIPTWTTDMLKFYWVRYMSLYGENGKVVSDYFVLFFSIGDNINFFPACSTSGYYAVAGVEYVENYVKSHTTLDPSHSDLDSSDTLYWLYSFGYELFNQSSVFADILNYRIGDVSLIGLLLANGFMIYMGWTIVKWFIPL